ncbi:hypothetical protein LTR53_012285 [Teratosphaeriaceae sp. CCFEE 6253]|nr:hypothetical protein LTR53_012285 [Teratosphaeriaceae sp. CCFEE 6253]
MGSDDGDRVRKRAPDALVSHSSATKIDDQVVASTPLHKAPEATHTSRSASTHPPEADLELELTSLPVEVQAAIYRHLPSFDGRIALMKSSAAQIGGDDRRVIDTTVLILSKSIHQIGLNVLYAENDFALPICDACPTHAFPPSTAASLLSRPSRSVQMYVGERYPSCDTRCIANILAKVKRSPVNQKPRQLNINQVTCGGPQFIKLQSALREEGYTVTSTHIGKFSIAPGTGNAAATASPATVVGFSCPQLHDAFEILSSIPRPSLVYPPELLGPGGSKLHIIDRECWWLLPAIVKYLHRCYDDEAVFDDSRTWADFAHTARELEAATGYILRGELRAKARDDRERQGGSFRR